jgi:hypothetical protein
MTRKLRFLVFIVGSVALWAVNPAAAQTVAFSYDDSLMNSSLTTVTGYPKPGGVCVFRPPALELGPAAGSAVEQRQVSVDFETCETVLETGVPMTIDASEGGANSDSEAAGKAKPAGSSGTLRTANADAAPSGRRRPRTATTRSGSRTQSISMSRRRGGS